MAWPEGRQCRWEPEVGDDALVGRTGLKGGAEQAGFGGSEGGCSINSLFLNFKQDFRFKNQRFEILLN
jgi:hypothetical protein